MPNRTIKNTPYADRELGHIRMKLDPVYERARDALKEARAHWMQDISHPWRGFDKLASPRDSQAQYIKLRSMLHGWYSEQLERLIEQDGIGLTPDGEITQAEINQLIANRKAKLSGNIAERRRLSRTGINPDIKDLDDGLRRRGG